MANGKPKVDPAGHREYMPDIHTPEEWSVGLLWMGPSDTEGQWEVGLQIPLSDGSVQKIWLPQELIKDVVEVAATVVEKNMKGELPPKDPTDGALQN